MGEQVPSDFGTRLRSVEEDVERLKQDQLRAAGIRALESAAVSGHLEGIQTVQNNRYIILRDQIGEVRVEVENIKTAQVGSNSLLREMNDRMGTMQNDIAEIKAILQRNAGDTPEEQSPQS